MNSSRIAWVALFSFGFLLYFSAYASAQIGGGAPRFSQPPHVRIIGTLVSREEELSDNLQTLAVYVKGKSWKLHIEKIISLTASTRSGSSLLRGLFPRKLNLIGADDLLAPLQQETIAGKPLLLEGRLYVGENQLLVSVVIMRD